jgi:glycogen debranching enzyme
MRRSFSDLRMLTSIRRTGLIRTPAVPWYSTIFGRDGIIAALMVLAVRSALARGVLSYLAIISRAAYDPLRAAEPARCCMRC